MRTWDPLAIFKHFSGFLSLHYVMAINIMANDLFGRDVDAEKFPPEEMKYEMEKNH